MSALADLDEKYDSVFFTLTKYIMYEKVTLDDTKTLLQSHECRLERYKFVAISHLSTVNISVKNDMKASYDNYQSNYSNASYGESQFSNQSINTKNHN